MGCMIIATPEVSDGAAIYAGSSTAAGPIANIQKMQPTDVWESNTTTPYFVLNFGSVIPINLVAMLFTNAVATDTWRIRTADTEGGLTSAPDEDTTATAMTDISPDGHVFHWEPDGWSNQWLRIDFALASSPFMAGRAYVANALQPENGRKYGTGDGYDDDSVIDATDGSALIPNDGANRAILNFTLNLKTEAERHSIREINRLRGSSGDMVVVTNPTASTNLGDMLYYGLMQRRRVAVNTAFNFNEVSYQLTSL